MTNRAAHTCTVEEFTFHWAMDPITKWRAAQIGGALDYVSAEDLMAAGLTAAEIGAWRTVRAPSHTGGPPANDPAWLGCALGDFARTFPAMDLHEATGWVIAAEMAGTHPVSAVREWLAQFPTGGWRYLAAGLSLAEAVAARDTGTLPGEEQVRVLAGLRVMSVPID